MSDMQAAHSADPQIGDVLASIRRLISQDGAGPDFATPIRRMDASGKARSALPLGPKAEMLRSVIARELDAVACSENRLVLRDEVPLGAMPVPPAPAGVTGDADGGSDDIVFGRGFDEAAYQLALRTGFSSRAAPVADISEIPSQPSASPTPMPPIQENDMMLAEIPRATSRIDADAPGGAGFDLFAADTVEEELDQTAGGNALRSLVRDVIRQELQGEMGDRISRNLRRAIRQEVAAAIEAGLKNA